MQEQVMENSTIYPDGEKKTAACKMIVCTTAVRHVHVRARTYASSIDYITYYVPIIYASSVVRSIR